MHTTPLNSERIVNSNLSQNSLYIWEDKVPVSMAVGKGSPLKGGRISAVYTPPHYRKMRVPVWWLQAKNYWIKDVEFAFYLWITIK